MEFFRDKSVLVTGSAGLIGANLAEALLRSGAHVRAVFRSAKPNLEGAEILQADLSSPECCKKIVSGVEIVFHCASNTPGAASTVGSPAKFVSENIRIDSGMLEAAYQAGVEKFIWPGSTTAYPPSEHPVREEELFNGEPHEKYFFMGWTKRFTEVLCRMYGEKMPPRPGSGQAMAAIVLRLSNVYGPHDNFDPKKSHVIPALIKKAVERTEPLEVWGTGEELRDVIYVDDVVRAMMMAAEKIERYDAFNIGWGKSFSVKEILAEILKADGYESARIQFDSSKPTTIPMRRVDISKAETTLGFKPEISLEEGIRRTADWYRKQQSRA